MSALPLGVNQIRIERGLTTSAVAIFVPFISQEPWLVLCDSEEDAKAYCDAVLGKTA